jgi:hypothetical protein
MNPSLTPVPKDYNNFKTPQKARPSMSFSQINEDDEDEDLFKTPSMGSPTSVAHAERTQKDSELLSMIQQACQLYEEMARVLNNESEVRDKAKEPTATFEREEHPKVKVYKDTRSEISDAISQKEFQALLNEKEAMAQRMAQLEGMVAALMQDRDTHKKKSTRGSIPSAGSKADHPKFYSASEAPVNRVASTPSTGGGMKSRHQIDPDSLLGRELSLIWEEFNPESPRWSSGNPYENMGRAGKSSRLNKIEPVPPESYDGAANITLFKRFVSQSHMYLKRGEAWPDECVGIIAGFLKGKAGAFWQNHGDLEGRHWTLEDFFLKLFDYCFSSHFYENNIQKIRSASQGSRDVRTYAEYISILYLPVGNYPGVLAKAHQFYNTLNPSIRGRLYSLEYHPRTMSFEALVEEAEVQERMIEIERGSSKSSGSGGRDNGGRDRDRRDSKKSRGGGGRGKNYPCSGGREQRGGH